MLPRISLSFVLAACAGTTSTAPGDNVPPGVVIRADSLVAGHGCGLGAGQVYKYAVTIVAVDDPPPQVVQVAGLFDCFADGLLANLTPSGGANPTYKFALTVYAYDKPTYDADRAQVAAALAPPYDFGAIASKGSYTYKTTCAASLPTAGLTSGNPLVQVLALCQPLANGPQADAGAPDAAKD